VSKWWIDTHAAVLLGFSEKAKVALLVRYIFIQPNRLVGIFPIDGKTLKRQPSRTADRNRWAARRWPKD
jgi:hypothetical protein